MTLSEILFHNVNDYLSDGVKHITVAYSGGVDSHVLLHALAAHRARLPNLTIQAVYIHHGLSPNANDWQTHCDKICKALDVSFQVVKVSVDVEAGAGLEAAARDARYQALIASTQDNGLILLGQHADDQLETVILQLKRGAGPQGLAAMPTVRFSERNIKLCRPLLQCTQQAILEYAKTNQLAYIEDESNSDTQIERNFLRLQVLPLLHQRWPGLHKAVARSASLCAEQQTLLDEITEQKLRPLMDAQLRLHVAGLQQFHLRWQKQLLRQWLKHSLTMMPSQGQLQQILQMLSAKPDAMPLVQLGEYHIRRFDGYLYCFKAVQAVGVDSPLAVDCQGRIRLVNTGQVLRVQQAPLTPLADQQEQQGTVLAGSAKTFTVEFAIPLNHGFKPQGKSHSKPLKQWYKNWKVPPWKRAEIPCLFASDWLVGIVIGDKIIANQNALDALTSRLQVSLARSAEPQ